MDNTTRELLTRYAAQYETARFLEGDPSWFMHQVEGRDNKEATAFVASCLSYGSRPQFMKKIQTILDWAQGDVDGWVRDGRFRQQFGEEDTCCFYRLFSCGTMCRFLATYQRLMAVHGSLGTYVSERATDTLSALETITAYFAAHDVQVVIPKDTQSACKRLCMFMRWMVRNDSPVDIGLWAQFLDRRTLIMPLDTHVLQQALRLSLLTSRTASMSAARRLTAVFAEVFPDDPLKGDFALFGYDIQEQ